MKDKLLSPVKFNKDLLAHTSVLEYNCVKYLEVALNPGFIRRWPWFQASVKGCAYAISTFEQTLEVSQSPNQVQNFTRTIQEDKYTYDYFLLWMIQVSQVKKYKI